MISLARIPRAGKIALVGAAASLCGCAHVFGPRATLGPGAIVRGRELYNDVISETNNEQTLKLIVRARYGEPSGLLSVGSVTANLHASAMTNAQFGIGPSKNYQGNIVPLSIGIAYEENPTISYTPVQGERYAKNILSPIGLETLVLLLGMERSPARLMSVIVKEVNGLPNRMDAPAAERAGFEASIDLLSRLEKAGQATWTATSTKPPSFALVIHDYQANMAAVHELLQRWGLPGSLARHERPVFLPVTLAVENPSKPAIRLQTRSVYDLVQLAASSVEVPPEHAAFATADPALEGASPLRGLLTIHSSRDGPSSPVLVAVRHHAYWFYVAADDGPSKLAFRLLQTLIDMRLIEAAPQMSPALTIPVAK